MALTPRVWFGTETLVAIDLVNADAVVQTGATEAVVDVVLADVSREPYGTATGVAAEEIRAHTSVLTRFAVTQVYGRTHAITCK